MGCHQILPPATLSFPGASVTLIMALMAVRILENAQKLLEEIEKIDIAHLQPGRLGGEILQLIDMHHAHIWMSSLY